ncbi:uncharacterized mitochondrial protein AtMg00810-like [Miscanthus floridulus]|uniref:uncharacterized mitochondrial protein AtMg00810-like n=1 Tax=Miscanthus floridulus TaxID=154761 RepID=UPI00345AEB15
MVLTGSSTAVLQHIVDRLRAEFATKDLGELRFFLGIDVKRTPSGFLLSQQRYAEDVFDRAGMLNCKPASMPIDAKGKLSADGAKIDDASTYRSLAGALQYITVTRPDLAFAVQQDRDLPITAYSDADWAGCPDTRRSTSGFCVFLGDALVSWSSKRQPTVSRSSAEAEYRAVANAAAECIWLRQLLGELQCAITKATVTYCDNISAVYMSANPVHHKRTKHIELDIHFVRERVQHGDLRVLHVPTGEQYADVMTKGLPIQFLRRRADSCDRGGFLKDNMETV